MVGSWCCVPECTNHSGHAPEGTSWHKFPLEPKRKQAWLHNNTPSEQYLPPFVQNIFV